MKWSLTTQCYGETSKGAKDSNKRPLEWSPTNVTPNAKQAVTSGTPTDNDVLRR